MFVKLHPTAPGQAQVQGGEVTSERSCSQPLQGPERAPVSGPLFPPPSSLLSTAASCPPHGHPFGCWASSGPHAWPTPLQVSFLLRIEDAVSYHICQHHLTASSSRFFLAHIPRLTSLNRGRFSRPLHSPGEPLWCLHE